MEIAKALLLTTGTPGPRPWPSVDPLPKALVPVANRPVLLHNLDVLHRSGVLEATVAVPHEAAAAVRGALADEAPPMRIGFVEHNHTDDLDAVLALTREFVGDEPLLVQDADALLHQRVNDHFTSFAAQHLDAVELRVGSPRSPNGAGAGGWMFSPHGLQLLREQVPPALDPMQRIRRLGGGVSSVAVDGALLRNGDQDDLLEANRRILDELRVVEVREAPVGCTVQGPVLIHPTARVERTLVRGPAIIGAGADVTDAYVGPYSSIGPDVVLAGVEIEYSIVLAGAELRHIGQRLESSIIGQRARIGRAFRTPAAMRLSVGHGAEIGLP
jgi:glucose-1-phosphate thymidylyltransferase